MATITTDSFFDDGARTPGESITVSTKAKLTLRTDTRVHANAPANMEGTIGTLYVSEGEFVVDGTQVRWLEFTAGSGVVPAIGTMVTQNAVSGYLLGVWLDNSSAPIVAGSAMPTNGFVKFREVTGGMFASGVLGGITATAVSSDVTGWLEVVHDKQSKITVPRLGTYTTQGDWFYLDDTTGTRGQVLQTPTNGGGVGSQSTGVEIETAPGSGVYDKYPAILPVDGSWNTMFMGVGNTDVRQQFVKELGDGKVQVGESGSITGTYTATIDTCSYTNYMEYWIWYYVKNNVAYVHTNSNYPSAGAEVYVAFQQGGLSGTEGTYILNTPVEDGVISFPVTAADTNGRCHISALTVVTKANHGLDTNDMVTLVDNSGNGISGTYKVTARNFETFYIYKVYNGITVANGTGTIAGKVDITLPATNFESGQEFTFTFDNVGVQSKKYNVVKGSTTSMSIFTPHTGASGTVTIDYEIGFVPVSGCKVRVPNVIYRAADVASRSTNRLNTSTIIDKPYMYTEYGGIINMSHTNAISLSLKFLKAYEVSLVSVFTSDTIEVASIFKAVVLDGCIVTSHYMASSQTPYGVAFNNVRNGSKLVNSKIGRAKTSSVYSYPLDTRYSDNFLIDNNVIFATDNINYGNASCVHATYGSSDCVISNNHIIGNHVEIGVNGVPSNNLQFTNNDITRKITGIYYGATSCVTMLGEDCVLDGLTIGYNNQFLGTSGSGYLVTLGSGHNTVRHIGSLADPVRTTDWHPDKTRVEVVTRLVANSKVQECYVDKVRKNSVYTSNDHHALAENIRVLGNDLQVKQLLYRYTDNSILKNVSGSLVQYGYRAKYGNGWATVVNNTQMSISLDFNEPTLELLPMFKVITGTPKFTGTGSMILPNAGDQVEYTCPFEIKGMTSFIDYESPLTLGPEHTVTSSIYYLVEYAIDNGSGFGPWLGFLDSTQWGAATDVTGFMLKLRITKSVTSESSLISLHVVGKTTDADMDNNKYQLDVTSATLTLDGLQVGADVVILEAGTQNVLASVDQNSSNTFTYTYTNMVPVDIGAIKVGYVTKYVYNYQLPSVSTSIPFTQLVDRNYN